MWIAAAVEWGPAGVGLTDKPPAGPTWLHGAIHGVLVELGPLPWGMAHHLVTRPMHAAAREGRRAHPSMPPS